jgi:hypothetical protein
MTVKSKKLARLPSKRIQSAVEAGGATDHPDPGIVPYSGLSRTGAFQMIVISGHRFG